MAPDSRKKLAISMAICATFLSSAHTTPAAKNSPEDYVELHNAARAAAGAGPVSWDAEAARLAARRAATGCTGLRTRSAADGGGYGENVFRGTGTGTPGTAWAAADAMRAWTAPVATEYVQVVWPATHWVGCAYAVCSGKRSMVISCIYKPAVKEELRGAPLPSHCRYNISRCFDCSIC